MTPKWMDFATAELGTKETPGSANNPRVVEYLKAAKGETLPDSTPWCAGFVGWCLNKAGLPDSDSLMARSYLKYGTKIDKPKFGAIAVYSRGEPPAGHVGFWVGEDGSYDIIRGGNQSDMVNDARQAKSRLLGYRWPPEPVPVPKPRPTGQGSDPVPEATSITHRDVKKTGGQAIVAVVLAALGFIASKLFGWW